MRLVRVNLVEFGFQWDVKRFQASHTFCGCQCMKVTFEKQPLRCTRNVNTTCKINYIQVRGEVQFGKIEMNISIRPDRKIKEKAYVNF